MNKQEAISWIGRLAQQWVSDPKSDVVYAEPDGPRWAVRIKQRTRDFTTVWFDVGDRSLRYEAYVLPAFPANAEEVYRLCLRWNERAWRVHFTLDADGNLFLRGRIALALLSTHEVESAVAEIYELVELSFRPLLRSREKKE